MTLITPASFVCDSYKLPHAEMYPTKMTTLFSTWVPRSARIAKKTDRQLDDKDEVVFFGITMALAKLEALWGEWFARDRDEVIDEYVDFFQDFLKVSPSEEQVDRIRDLHDLGYLPLEILHLPEGTVTKTGVVQLVVFNMDPRFAWLTNYIETALSAELWKPQTTATIARNYRKLMEEYAAKTCDNNLHVDWQCHDFSMRGLSGIEDSEHSSVGHLLYFNGTDTLPSVWAAREYYGGFDVANYGSVPATEHSVMCAGSQETEQATYDRLLDQYPTGILSVVSDTWDYWKVLTETLPALKDKIMARDGKLVIRPDSGDPVEIICGRGSDGGHPRDAGTVQLLWDVFGGTINEKGYKVLDPHIGVIYGDSITLERASRILAGLEANGFAASNIVFGVGSFTYQANTRDTFGFAMKATGMVLDGQEVALFKDPITDDGTKKSFKGFLTTRQDADGKFHTVDGLAFDEIMNDSSFVYAGDYEGYLSGSDIKEWDQIKMNARVGL